MPVRIAILEDDSRQRDALARTFAGSTGYVLAASFASLADLKQARRLEEIDVVLVDIQLPDGTGIEAIRRLKQLDRRPRCIVLTVLGDSETLFQALQAGADGYLLKRGDSKSLLARLGELLAGEVPLSPAVARRMLDFFRQRSPLQPGELDTLTASEREVLGLLSRGMTNKEIADARSVTLATVRTQLAAIYEKLQVRTRTEAVALFHRRP